jgi:hypothetical protein
VGVLSLNVFGCLLWCGWRDGRMCRRLEANATDKQPVTSTNFPRRDRPLIINQPNRIGLKKPNRRLMEVSLHEPRARRIGPQSLSESG